MLQTHFARVIRNFSRNRFYAFINLSVLVTGITSCIMVILYLEHQSNFDAHHVKAEQIFRLSTHIKMGKGEGHVPQTSASLGPLLKKENLFVEEYARFHPFNFESFNVQTEDKIFKATGILGAEPNVFKIFTYPMLAGNPVTALKEPNSIVVTESFARKYLGSGDCLGKILKIDHQDYNVTGLIEDLPNNSDLNFEALLSYDFEEEESWDDITYFTYVLVKNKDQGSNLNQALNDIEELHIRPYHATTGMNIELDLAATPLRKVHFTQGMLYDTPKSNYNYVYIFSAIGLFMLSIASFNYINLAAVQSFKRSKEVAVKGVLGVRRLQIIFQFISESLILTLISLFISLILVSILLPYFNGLAQINVPFLNIFHWKSLTMISFVVVILGITSAIVPALYLTSFSLPKILKGTLPNFNKGFLYRLLLIAQFAMSLIMIICTLAVYRQMQYMKDMSLGFVMDKVIVIQMPDEMDFKANTALKNELSKYNSLSKISLIGENATPGSSMIEKHEAITEKEDEEAIMDVFNIVAVDENYLDLLKIQLIQGRNFNPLMESDLRNSFIVNEAFVKHVGWKDPINKKIDFHNGGKVIGVVKDYNYKSLHNKIEPLLLYYNLGGPNNEMLVKIRSESDIDILRQTWKKHVGNRPFYFSFLDQSFNRQYQQEEATMTMFFMFSGLVIALTCFGLFGLSSLITKQRIKEIGIRKVLGGKEINIIYVLLKDIVVLLFLSIFIAAPVAKYGVDMWQRDFTYQVQVGIFVYLLAWCLVLFTTLFTALYHTLKAVNTNPALALRHE